MKLLLIYSQLDSRYLKRKSDFYLLGYMIYRHAFIQTLYSWVFSFVPVVLVPVCTVPDAIFVPFLYICNILYDTRSFLSVGGKLLVSPDVRS